MKNPKVLILYNRIFHYRVPVWNILSQKCDLTVSFSEGNVPDGMPFDFKVLYLPCKRFGRFVIHKDNIRSLAKRFDVVIAYGDIAWLKFSTLSWFNNTKVIFWTIGVSASYDKLYDERHSWDHIRSFFYSKAKALIFYSFYPVNKYRKSGFPREKLFVAPNTVSVLPIDRQYQKNSILFIGSLYKQKGIQLLLEAYRNLNKKINLPVLYIIGEGEEFNEIENWIKLSELSGKIFMLGAIYDNKLKAKYFSQALACISPRQAGLSVLESMGYGVPFITSARAITGGELFNIHNGIDGVIINNDSEINSVVADIATNPIKYIRYGINAKYYYDNNRTVNHMADGLYQAIQYAIST